MAKTQMLSFPLRLPDCMQAESLRLLEEKVSAVRKALDDPDSYMAMTNVIEQACNHFLKNEAWPQTYEDLQPVPVMSVGQLTFAGDDGLEKGQTYRAKIDYVHMCDLVTHEERQRARLYLHLRAPSESGTWTWGQVCGVIELPESVVSRLSQGAMPQAPTLREIRTDDGSRLAVLDLILEVPATYVNELDQECRVLGWDWGVRSLITVSILEKPEGDGQESYRQISRPVFLESGGLDGRQARLRREIDRRKRVPRTLWEARQRSGHRSCRTQETVTSPFPEMARPRRCV